MYKSSMQCFGNGHFHKGFYILGIENISAALSEIINPKWNFEDIDNDKDGFAYQNADVFKMGSCHLFSLALSQEFGLPAYELRGAQNRFIHAFCIVEFSKKKVYVDVRGSTTDLREFLTGLYVDPKEKLFCLPQNVKGEKDCLTADEKLGYEFALEVIRRNPSFYSAPNL